MSSCAREQSRRSSAASLVSKRCASLTSRQTIRGREREKTTLVVCDIWRRRLHNPTDRTNQHAPKRLRAYQKTPILRRRPIQGQSFQTKQLRRSINQFISEEENSSPTIATNQSSCWCMQNVQRYTSHSVVDPRPNTLMEQEN